MLEDAAALTTTRVSQILRAIAPGVTTTIDFNRMYDQPRRGVEPALEAYKQSPWLQASTKKIAERFAAVEWRLFVQTGSGGKAMQLGDPRSVARTIQRSYLAERQRMLLDLKQAGELKQIHRHPLLEMLSYANPMMTGYAGRLLTQVHRDIAGEAFWALGLNSAGKPSEFWPIPPPWVTGLPTEKSQSYEVTIYGRCFSLPAEQVIWFREPDPSKPYGRGTGIAMSLGDELETDEYAAKFTKNFFLNRAKPELMIMVEGASENALAASKMRFEQQHQGFQRAHRSWWYNSKIEVKELTQKFVDMELGKLRDRERDTVLQVLGLPPEQMGIVTNSNRATAHESEKTMATSVLVPRLESMREQLQEELAPQYDPRLILGYVSPVPDDRDYQLEAIKAAPWAATRGEVRRMQGLRDRGKGDDVHMQQLNLIEMPAPKTDKIKRLRARAKSLTSAGITVVLNALRPERIIEEVEPVWSEELQEWGDKVLADLGLDVSFNLLNPLVVDHMRSVTGEHITGMISDTTRAAVQGELIEGVEAGEGYLDLAKRVRGVFDQADKARSELIARTETVRSASFATDAALMQAGIVWGEEWLATPGSERHGAAGYGGTVKKLGDVFVFSDGKSAPYPGGFGDPGDDCNCMCCIIPVIEDPDKALKTQDSKWREVNARRLVWQRIAQAAYRRGFRKQETDVLAALKKAAT